MRKINSIYDCTVCAMHIVYSAFHELKTTLKINCVIDDFSIENGNLSLNIKIFYTFSH